MVDMSTENPSLNVDKGIEKSVWLEAKDILNTFNKNIYPKIRKQYKDDKRIDIINILWDQNVSSLEEDADIIWRREVGKWIIELVFENWPEDDLEGLQLLFDVMYLDIRRNAYGNSLLSFSYASNRYNENGELEKADTIKELIELCKQKFRSWKTINFKDDYVTIKDGDRIIIQHKNDNSE